MRECLEKRKVPANKRHKKAGSFRCGSAEHFVRNCLQLGPQPGAVSAPEELGSGADRNGLSSAMET